MRHHHLSVVTGTVCLNKCLFGIVSSALADSELVMEVEDDDDGGLEMEVHLDSHANMPVLGKGCCIISVSQFKAEVSAYTDKVGKLHKVPVVDAALLYQCPYSNKTCLLVVRNALHVPSMKHHLIPPFVMREAGVVVNEVPKFQIGADDRSVEDHSLCFEKSKLRIHMKLDGIFSFFQTRKPTAPEVEEVPVERIECLTPDSNLWNPDSEHFATNEDAMLSWNGELVNFKEWEKALLTVTDWDEEEYEISSVEAMLEDPTFHERSQFSDSESDEFDRACDERGRYSCFSYDPNEDAGTPVEEDEIYSAISAMDPSLELYTFAQRVATRAAADMLEREMLCQSVMEDSKMIGIFLMLSLRMVLLSDPSLALVLKELVQIIWLRSGGLTKKGRAVLCRSLNNSRSKTLRVQCLGTLALMIICYGISGLTPTSLLIRSLLAKV